jgi:hypothetical protein
MKIDNEVCKLSYAVAAVPDPRHGTVFLLAHDVSLCFCRAGRALARSNRERWTPTTLRTLVCTQSRLLFSAAGAVGPHFKNLVG